MPTQRAPNHNLKKLLHIAGLLAALLATALVIYRLAQDNRYLEVAAALSEKLPILISLCLSYALLNGLLCFGWAKICLASGVRVGTPFAMGLFARTHIYRYLPSNILHFVGRHVGLKNVGASHPEALLVNSLEVGLQITSAAILACVLWLLSSSPPWHLPESTGALRFLFPLLLITGVGLAAAIVHRQRLATLPTLGFCLTVYVLFFMGSGVTAAQLSNGNADLQTITLVATIAWLGGALIPGASAGLGIRELLVISGLTPLIGASDALALALGFRLVTIGGDLLLTCIAWLFPVRQDPEPEDGKLD